MKSLLREEEKKDVKILAISMDSHDDARKMIYETDKPDYPGAFDLLLLSDPQHKTVDAYGVYNPGEELFDEATGQHKESGIPYPIVYIITKDGKVGSRLFDAIEQSRATNAQIRSELLRLGIIKS